MFIIILIILHSIYRRLCTYGQNRYVCYRYHLHFPPSIIGTYHFSCHYYCYFSTCFEFPLLIFSPTPLPFPSISQFPLSSPSIACLSSPQLEQTNSYVLQAFASIIQVLSIFVEVEFHNWYNFHELLYLHRGLSRDLLGGRLFVIFSVLCQLGNAIIVPCSFIYHFRCILRGLSKVICSFLWGGHFYWIRIRFHSLFFPVFANIF